MSEPSETSGCPLVPTILQLQQPDAGTVQQLASAHSESEASSPSPSRLSETKTRPKTHRRPRLSLEASSKPHPDSSRPKRRSTASPTNMASSPSSVNYTRTGRISKAKKGLKVHHCENCGRSYTRAEHLRRHQKNHAQDGALLCDFPDCDKTFYRIDLLQRHQERHNEPGRVSRHASTFSPDPEGSPEPRQSSAPENLPSNMVAVLPADPSFHTPQPASPVHESPTLTRYTTNLFRTPQLPRTVQAPTSTFNHVIHSSPSFVSPNQAKHHRSFANRNSTGVSMQVDGTTPMYSWSEFHSQSPGYSSSDGYVSPNPASNGYSNMFPQMPYCPEPSRTRASSNASLIEPPWSYASRSPASTNSTMAYTWASGDKTSDAPGLDYIGGTYPMTSMPILSSVDPMTGFCHYDPKTMMQRDDEENVILFGEHPYGMGPNAHTHPFEQDLDCYWRFFHPNFPIIHRPTFRRLTASPMLYAAMIAIGGQYSSDASVKRKSRILHDRCLKLLERREQDTMTESERLLDYQATFLIEYISQFRSRRSAKTLSGRFVKVYHKSVSEFKHVNTCIAKIVSPLDQSNDDASDQWQHWVELTSWQRLLQACYILESQQALLLAREPKSSLIQATGYDLPFPAALEVWDAESAYEWKSAIQQYPAVFWYIYEISSDLISRPLDTFQSSILLAAYYNRFDTTAPYALQPPTLDLDGHLDSSPGTVRQQLTWKLVHVTPIRALLAIPGESWIFSEKVSSIQAFGGLRRTLQTWVVQLWATDGILAHTAPVKTALQLSVAILEAALGEQQNSMTPEVGTDLGIFFAALVLWSVTTAASTRFKEDHQRPQMPCYHRQPPLSLPLTSRALSSVTSSPQSSLCKPLDQPPLVVDAGTQPALRCLPGIPTSPTSQTRHDSTCMLSHAQITINTIQFLSSALTDFEEVGSQRWTASDLGRCQTGCISLLLWVKLRLRGVSLEDETADGWSSSTGESLGELLDGIITMLEKMLGRGWDEWGI